MQYCAPVSSRFKWIHSAAIVISPIEPLNMESVMNWDVIEGNWAQYKGNVKAQWGKLTNDNLDVIAGKRDALAGQIQKSYGMAMEDADKQIKAFQKYLNDSKPS